MPTNMLLFCDLPDRIRFAARDAIDAAGGYVAGYCGPAVQVAIPRPAGPFFRAMEAAGLELDESSLHHFPLGSDGPPDHLRHKHAAGVREALDKLDALKRAEWESAWAGSDVITALAPF